MFDKPLDKKNILEKHSVGVHPKQKIEPAIPMWQRKEYIEICEKCGNEKIKNISCVVCEPLDDYTKNKREYESKYYYLNRDKLLNKQKKWNKENKEQIHLYYIENREEILKRNTKWQTKNKDKSRSYSQTYYEKNKEKKKEAARQRYHLKKQKEMLKQGLIEAFKNATVETIPTA